MTRSRMRSANGIPTQDGYDSTQAIELRTLPSLQLEALGPVMRRMRRRRCWMRRSWRLRRRRAHGSLLPRRSSRSSRWRAMQITQLRLMEEMVVTVRKEKRRLRRLIASEGQPWG
jgi:hypothetical protein